MSNITALQFQSHTLQPIQHNDQVWLTSADLALALDYKSTKSITNLYNQNSDEFTDCMAQVIDSVTSGNYRKKTRIFSLRGAHLIAMFSRTPVAKEFRKWVLDILDKETAEPKTELIEPEVTHFITLKDNELCELVWLWKSAYHMRKEIEEIEPALRLIKSDHSASFYSMGKEYIGILNRAQKTLLRETADIDIKNESKADTNWYRALKTLRS